MSRRSGPKPLTYESESDWHDEALLIISHAQDGSVNTPTIRPFIGNFHQLAKFAEDAYRKNIQLLEIISQMNAQIITNAAKIRLIEQSSHGHIEGISKLKEEYENAARMIRFSHDAEVKSRRLLNSLRRSIEFLSEKVSRGDLFAQTDDGSAFDVRHDVGNLRKELDSGHADIEGIRRKIDDASKFLTAHTEQQARTAAECDRLTAWIAEQESRSAKMQPEIENASAAVQDLRDDVKAKQNGLNDLQVKKMDLVNINKAKRRSHATDLAALSAMHDQARIHRDKMAQKVRVLSELRRSSAIRETRLSGVEEQLGEVIPELESLRTKIEAVWIQNVELNKQFNDNIAEARRLSDEKQAVRKVLRALRPVQVNLRFRLARSDNTGSLKQKAITAAEAQLDDQGQEVREAREQDSEIRSAITVAGTTNKDLKRRLEQMKEKIVQLLNGLDEDRRQTFRTAASTDIECERRAICNSQNEQQLEDFRKLQDRCERQVCLSDQLRNERNNSKRQFEALERENAALVLKNNEVEETIVPAKTQLDSMLQSTAMDLFEMRKIVATLAFLEEEVIATTKQIQQVERITSRFQAEVQTLNYILREAKNDHLQQIKEVQLALSSKNVIQWQLHQKDGQVMLLRGQIKAAEIYRLTYERDYRKKLMEIAVLREELKVQDGITRELEEKIDRFGILEFEMQGAMKAALLERHRCLTLIHEFSIRRNVHRWQVLATVDPGFVRSLKFRTALSARINDRHQQLFALQEERELLKKQLRVLKESSSAQVNDIERRQLTQQEIQRLAAEYENRMKKMEQQIRETEEQLMANRQLLAEHDRTIQSYRDKLCFRWEQTRQIEEDIRDARSHYSSGPCYFMTEPPIIKPAVAGGGFNRITCAAAASSPAAMKVLPVVPSDRKRKAVTSLSYSSFGVQAMVPRYYGMSATLPAMS
jgi:chromosome segregation ATPase